MLRSLYLSPFGIIISLVLRIVAKFYKNFMVYGYSNKVDGRFYKRTRIASDVQLIFRKKIDIKDNVWVGYHCLIDGIGGVTIGEGVNVASHTCIYSHSSQNSIRLLGKKFIEIPAEKRIGYILEPVKIGEYTFIGTSCVVLPGTSIGRGCVVGAGSVVKGDFPDYSVIVGNPAKVVGDTRDTDAKLKQEGLDFSHYYDPELKEQLNK